MIKQCWIPVLALSLAAIAEAGSHPTYGVPGRMVAVSVEIDGETAPLYAAPDGSGRYYVEAREGSPYMVCLTNRTDRRVGVALAVDGLNVISGEQDSGAGRMYVLSPFETTVIRGWRTSLSEVRHFTFVDERVSYAARSGKANRKMGWIEIAVYRERCPRHSTIPVAPRGREQSVPQDGETPAASPPAVEEKGRDQSARSEARSFPGTGWGDRTDDRAELVDFFPEARPADRVVLRYEYAAALRALGILPQDRSRDRLSERERGVDGFAQPPVW